MGYKPLLEVRQLIQEELRAYIESGHRDWNNGWHSDGWAQSMNDKYLEKLYREAEKLKIGKNASNLDKAIETVVLKKTLKKTGLAAYSDGGTYTDWSSDYWAVYTEY